MKKIFILLMIALWGMIPNLKAQETTLIPQKGDWALGTDVVPLLKTLGNVFYNNTSSAGFGGNTGLWAGTPSRFTPSVSLLGKYMLTDQIAVRANIGVSFSNVTTKASVVDFAASQADPLSTSTLLDKASTKQNGFSLALGGEYRIGKKRVQGVFGADLLLGYYSDVIKNTYGNGLSDIYFGGADAIQTTPGTPNNATSVGSMRTLQSKTSDIFQIGAQVSAGIEVFVAPKIALGGQVNLSYVANVGGKTHITGEYFDANTQSVRTWTNKTGATATTQTFSTNNIGAALYMMFYFAGK